MPTRRSVLIGASSAAVLANARAPATAAPNTYFPPRPGDAPFPSPEGARIEVRQDAGGRPYLSGPPYLRDSYGQVHTMRLAPTSSASGHVLYPWFINNRMMTGGRALEVAQGNVFCNWLGTAWYQSKIYNNGVWVGPLPPRWESDAFESLNPSGKGTKFFPADSAGAPPSPENACSLWWNGSVQGAPYLKDRTGTVFEIRPFAASGNDSGRLFINGASWRNYLLNEMLVRQGIVYLHIPGMVWQWRNPAMNSVYSVLPPPAWAADTTATANPHVPLPPEPPRPAVLPGSSGRRLRVGPGGQFNTVTDALNAAADGDTVLVGAGTYREAFAVRKRVLLKGEPGAKIDATDVPPALDKGAIVAEVDCVIQGLEIVGAGIRKKSSDLTCGVRIDGPGWYELRDLYVHRCMDGIGSSGGLRVMLSLEDIRIEDCGIGDGLSHNVYVNDVVRLVANNVVSTNPKGGHAFKTRAYVVRINGGRFEATDATVLDFPDGTIKPFLVRDARLTKPAGAANHDIFSYAVEHGSRGNAGGTFMRCTIDARCPHPNVFTEGGPIKFVGCTFRGNSVGAYGPGASQVSGLPRRG